MKINLKLLAISLVSVVSLLLGFGAPAYAQTAQDQINNGLCAGSNLQFTATPGSCAAASSDATTKINDIVHTVVNLLSALVGIVAVIMIIIGGFRYITSGGNDTSVTAAKNTILYAIIGLVVVALAQIIVRFTLSKLTQ
ncbi:pilin [Candidatus Saccharibacteria bacterium]|nr:pilin [Candidatus Saccharibacteria bacterium]